MHTKLSENLKGGDSLQYLHLDHLDVRIILD